MKKNKLLIAATVFVAVAIAAILVYLWRAKPKSLWLKSALGMIMGGGVGNMIDRTVNGYVVDFFEVEFVDFAVFNVADAFITVACGILIVYLAADAVKESKAGKKRKSENNE